MGSAHVNTYVFTDNVAMGEWNLMFTEQMQTTTNGEQNFRAVCQARDMGSATENIRKGDELIW